MAAAAIAIAATAIGRRRLACFHPDHARAGSPESSLSSVIG
jgi:hypothetical protein